MNEEKLNQMMISIKTRRKRLYQIKDHQERKQKLRIKSLQSQKKIVIIPTLKKVINYLN